VRIDVTVPPGHELVAEEKQIDNGTHEPLAKAIHDAFKIMERELRRVVDKQRRNVKTHADSRSPK
jgi:ribosome-associated translation inhibitor RaiA